MMRMYARRKLASHPLFVTVAVPESAVYAKPDQNRVRYIAIGLLISLLVLAAMFYSLLHQRRLDLARQALADSEAHAQRKSRELELTLEHMGQGIIMVDGRGQVLVTNDKAMSLLELPMELAQQRGTSMIWSIICWHVASLDR
jgi:signal transduction histidine kinase